MRIKAASNAGRDVSRKHQDEATVSYGPTLYLHRSCEPLVQIDFGSLAPNTLDPMTVGGCLGLCGN
jgi:hypothetical protein